MKTLITFVFVAFMAMNIIILRSILYDYLKRVDRLCWGLGIMIDKMGKERARVLSHLKQFMIYVVLFGLLFISLLWIV